MTNIIILNPFRNYIKNLLLTLLLSYKHPQKCYYNNFNYTKNICNLPNEIWDFIFKFFISHYIFQFKNVYKLTPKCVFFGIKDCGRTYINFELKKEYNLEFCDNKRDGNIYYYLILFIQ